jgi:hypothetical protein
MVVGWLALACTPGIERTTEPYAEGAYVWQHTATAAVERAVRERGSEFAGIWQLVAEVDWQGGAASIHRVAPVADRWVVRVEVPPEGVDPLPVIEPLFRELAGRGPAELQLDLDAPTRRLPALAGWVRALEAAVEPVPLTVTALPTWLDEPAALRRVAAAADGWLLQVHGGAGPILDPQALSHIEQAARIGEPFRVALPTYRDAGTGHSADPLAVARVVAELRRERPAAVVGLWWFRLPIGSERDDPGVWVWPTLEAVREGRAPVAHARVELRADEGGPDEGGAVTVALRNDGERDLSLPNVELWPGVELAGGVGGYRWSWRTGELVAPTGTIRPGAERIVGWVRGPVPADWPHELEVEP